MQTQILPADPDTCRDMLDDQARSFVAPMDDMWAAFARMATPFMVLRDGKPIAHFAVDDQNELRMFHVRPAIARPDDVFRQVVNERGIGAALPATIDPAFTAHCLDHAAAVEVKALLYHHAVAPEPVKEPLGSMRVAADADHAAAVAFCQRAIGAPPEFLNGYLAQRIAAGELFLHATNDYPDEILGTGEFRADDANPGTVHLGLIVGEAARGKGLGTAIFDYLVREAIRRNLTPLCSTEPENAAARRVIERSGFRSWHRVLRVRLAQPA